MMPMEMEEEFMRKGEKGGKTEEAKKGRETDEAKK